MKELIILLIATVTGTQVNTITPPRCVAAQPNVDTVSLKDNCLPYRYPADGFCRDVIGKSYAFGTIQHQSFEESMMRRFDNGRKVLEGAYGVLVRKTCFKWFTDVYCRWAFPKCDKTSGKLQGKPICKETCNYVSQLCDKELDMAKTFNYQQSNSSYRFYWRIMNCATFPSRNGGDIPECYFTNNLNTETDKLEAVGCYYGNGLGYRGNLTVTRSGYLCQSWSSQCPHRHDHPLVEHSELINASNWCRNPGGQAPKGPWCYTTNTSIRWEYCNIEKCPPPAPTRKPAVVRAYASGSSKITLEWRPVPLPFMHGQPQGFRIMISKLGRKNPISVNTTRPDVNYFEFRNLQPSTNYSLSLLAFNENGDGPWSRRVFVKTMPQNFVAGRFMLVLNKEKFSNDLLNRTSNRYKTLTSALKHKIASSLENTTSKGFKIYHINIIRFNQSSVHVDFDITAELLYYLERWSVMQYIAGRILREFEKNKNISSSGQFSSLIVKDSPPPPENLIQSDVQVTSAILSWSAPNYYRAYRITNYTVQYKKAGTKMVYYDAVQVSSEQRKVTVRNLDSDTKYLMRVKSVNSYGIQPSQPIVVKTKGKPILAIVLPLVSLVVVALVLSGLSLRWWYTNRQQEKERKTKLEMLIENPYESIDVDWFKMLKIRVTGEWLEISHDDLTTDLT